MKLTAPPEFGQFDLCRLFCKDMDGVCLTIDEDTLTAMLNAALTDWDDQFSDAHGADVVVRVREPGPSSHFHLLWQYFSDPSDDWHEIPSRLYDPADLRVQAPSSVLACLDAVNQVTLTVPPCRNDDDDHEKEITP
jgi:hypothetical protein